jgi:hypothetical protein
MKTAILSLFLLVSWLPVSASATDVYKWLDENGTPSYGERPPEGVKHEKVKIYGVSSSTRTGSYFSTPNSTPNATPKDNDNKTEPDRSTTQKGTP